MPRRHRLHGRVRPAPLAQAGLGPVARPGADAAHHRRRVADLVLGPYRPEPAPTACARPTAPDPPIASTPTAGAPPWPRPTSSTPSARPSGKRGGGLSQVHPADLGRPRRSARSSSAPASTRPPSRTSCSAASTPSARQAGDIARTCVAGRRPARGGAGHHHRPPVRLVAAGRALRRPGRDERHRRPGRGRRRAEHEHDPDLVGHDRRRAASASPTRSPARRAGMDRYGDQEISQFRGAELIAEKWDITREDMEAFALESHRRALQATDEGRFEREIAPARRASPPTRAPPRHDPGEDGRRSSTLARGRPHHRRRVEPDLRRRARRMLIASRAGGEGPRPHARGPASTTSACAATTRSSC